MEDNNPNDENSSEKSHSDSIKPDNNKSKPVYEITLIARDVTKNKGNKKISGIEKTILKKKYRSIAF